jgi:hypothetical protein
LITSARKVRATNKWKIKVSENTKITSFMSNTSKTRLKKGRKVTIFDRKNTEDITEVIKTNGNMKRWRRRSRKIEETITQENTKVTSYMRKTIETRLTKGREVTILDRNNTEDMTKIWLTKQVHKFPQRCLTIPSKIPSFGSGCEIMEIWRRKSRKIKETNTQENTKVRSFMRKTNQSRLTKGREVTILDRNNTKDITNIWSTKQMELWRDCVEEVQK